MKLQTKQRTLMTIVHFVKEMKSTIRDLAYSYNTMTTRNGVRDARITIFRSAKYY
jgi:hypothetical protein